MDVEDVIPNRWVRFTRAWDWDVPKYKGRATKTFPVGAETRLTRDQFQSAMSAGAVVCIPNPRHARTEESGNGGPSELGSDP